MLSLAGCGEVPQRIPSADELTIYSLKEGHKYSENPIPGYESFGGYPVLGKLEIVDPAERAAIVTALNKSIAEESKVADCYQPRHGFHILTAGKSYGYTVCFGCGQYQSIEVGNPDGGAISTSAQPRIDAILRKAGVPLNRRQYEMLDQAAE
ncbi:MAG: hypothetical protein QM811_00045 [Pirellulales bacterium]